MGLRLFTWSLVCALLQSSAQSGFYVEVPYVHQVRNYCGPAVLAMVFDYWDRSVDISTNWHLSSGPSLLRV